MSLRLIFISLLLSLSLCYYYDDNSIDRGFTLTNFTFGSCFYGRLSKNLTIFNSIQKHHSNLWIWLGDAAYVDEPNLVQYYRSTFPNNWTRVEYLFNKSKSNEYYQQMAKNTPVIGVWDDHDYGINDGNGNYADKDIIKKYYLDFLDVPANNHRRQPNKGIYSTYSFGDGYKTVRIILLDVRYSKSGYMLNFHQDMLGEEQWKWLEDVLSSSNETLTFIASGTQILPFNRIVTEAWYQKSRLRLFNLISKTKRNGVILLSGDVHFGQILKTFCVMSKVGYDLYELTSSGLSHYLNVSYYIDNILPNNYNLGKSYSGYNFGEVKIDWGNSIEETKVSLGIFDIDDNKQIEHVIEYKDLVYNKERINEEENCDRRINKRFKNAMEYIDYYCANKSELWIGLIYLALLILVCHLLSNSVKTAAMFIGFVLLVFVVVASYFQAKDRKHHEALFN